jgi:hypothetical protein
MEQINTIQKIVEDMDGKYTGGFPVVGFGIGEPKGEHRWTKIKLGDGIDVLDINPDTGKEYIGSFLKRLIRNNLRNFIRKIFRFEPPF